MGGEKKKAKDGRKGDRHTQPRKAFHGPPELFEALAAYLAGTVPAPAKSAVLRVALEEFLAKRGFWPAS